MKRKQRVVLVVLGGGLLGLMLAEQITGMHFYYAWALSGTHTYDRPKPTPSGDITSLTQVDRPFARWLPFIKFGETVHTHTAWERAVPAEALEHGSIVRTRVIVIGFCSTARYDELADRPFAEWQKNPINLARMASQRR